MSAPRRKITLASALVASLALLGCGSEDAGNANKAAMSVARGEAAHPIQMFPAIEQGAANDQTVIIRVGSVPITKAAFAHWDKALTPRLASYEPKSRADCSSVYAPREVQLPKRGPKLPPAEVKALCVRQKQELVKEAALKELISYQWVIGEAEELGLRPRETEVHQALAKSVSRQFKHKKEFQRFLERSGRTMADLLLEVRQELASQRIHELIERKAQGQSPDHGRIEHYYREHRKSSFQGEPLKQVEGTVSEEISEEMLNRKKARFIRDFREKWLARTTCTVGYVISHCREWRGPSLVRTADPYGVD